MARANLHAFLLKLEKELEKGSKTYRKYTSDVKPHTFYLSRQGLESQIHFQMQRDGLDPAKVNAKPIIAKYFKDLKTAFTGNLHGVVVHRKKITNVSFSVTVSPAEDHKRYFTHKNSFVLLKSIMFNSKRTFNNSMRKLYKNANKNFRENVFLDVGHAGNSAVWDHRVSDALTEFGEVPTSLMNIEEVALIFSLVKIDEKGEINASLESASKNRSHGAGLKKDKVHLQGLIADALLKLEAEGLTGSDSLIGRKKKEVRQKVLEPFKKVKGATVVSRDLDFKPSEKSAVKLKKSRKIQDARGRRARAQKVTRTKKRSASAQPLQLLGLLNQKLPETVRKNMKEPGLVNRSGRFAESVKVTEIAQTPKGFPSIGYTYRRNPYQVFEEGSSGEWSNGHRDPRDLIDKSIREIAAQFAIGRFYTRRV
jgi:hypothetical protein